MPRVSTPPCNSTHLPACRACASLAALTGGRPSAPRGLPTARWLYAAARANGYFLWGFGELCLSTACRRPVAAFVSRAPAHLQSLPARARSATASHSIPLPPPCARASARPCPPQLLRAPAAARDKLPQAQVRALERAAHQEEAQVRSAWASFLLPPLSFRSTFFFEKDKQPQQRSVRHAPIRSGGERRAAAP